jgi:hypothetical protein
MVVDVDHRDPIDGTRQFRIRFLAWNDRHVIERPFLPAAFDLREVVCRDRVRIDPTARPDGIRQAEREVAVPGADIGNRHAGTRVGQGQERIEEGPSVLG